MHRLAVLGAGGFIGARAVELYHLTDAFAVRPIVHRPGAAARSARFGLDTRLASAADGCELEASFRDCDAVLHLASGNPRVIADSVRPVYDAAARAGVRRIVYLSSAAVHGQAPDPLTDETTPLHEHHPLPYNNAKVRAERQWNRLAQDGRVEVVILRPSIVFGPRSRWIAGCADELLAGRAYLVDHGLGVCNTLYVDNLLHAVRLALTVDAANGQTFLIGERDRLTWAEFNGAIARVLGIDPDTIHQVQPREDQRHTLLDRLLAVRSTTAAQAVLRRTPDALKRGIKGTIASWTQRPAAPPASAAPVPDVTLEMTLLHRCRWQLPWSKAATVLGYQPVVTFEEGFTRSMAWLAFAGYPI